MTRSPQQESPRPQPRCPNCGYDLVGTIAANKRVCPECGERFSMSELARGGRRRREEWTFAQGLRTLLTTQAVRGALTLAVWTGVAILLAYVFNWIPLSIWTLGAVALVLAIPGIPIGHALSKGVTEAAGCESIIFTVIVLVVAYVVVWAGVMLAAIVNPMPDWSGFTIMATVFFAGLWIIRNMHFETG